MHSASRHAWESQRLRHARSVVDRRPIRSRWLAAAQTLSARSHCFRSRWLLHGRLNEAQQDFRARAAQSAPPVATSAFDAQSFFGGRPPCSSRESHLPFSYLWHGARAMGSVDIKLTFDAVTRRVTLPASPTPTWSALVALVAARFSLAPSRIRGLAWVDRDGDSIVLCVAISYVAL